MPQATLLLTGVIPRSRYAICDGKARDNGIRNPGSF